MDDLEALRARATAQRQAADRQREASVSAARLAARSDLSEWKRRIKKEIRGGSTYCYVRKERETSRGVFSFSPHCNLNNKDIWKEIFHYGLELEGILGTPFHVQFYPSEYKYNDSEGYYYWTDESIMVSW